MESVFKKCIADARNLTLLYVEDNIGARAGSMLIFEEFFGHVIEAIDGEDALEKFKQNDVDLVITDINMPKMNGLEMTEKIRHLSPKTPVLVLSAYNETHYFMECIRLGVAGYLLKPIEIGQFMEVLGSIIEKIHLKAEYDKLQDLLTQYLEVTNKSAIVSKTNKDGIITYVNDAFCAISGFARNEIIGKNYSIIRHKDMPTELFKELWETITQGELWQGIIKNRCKTGSSYYTKTAIKPILNSKGEIVEYIALHNDITEVMNPKKQLFDYISSTPETVIVLLKIEDFATVEEFYSNDLVELLERKLGEKIFYTITKECPFEKIYALGFGEYALALDINKCPLDADALKQKVKHLLKEIEADTIHLNEIEYNVSLLASLAYGGKEPYQSAHFGLKKAERKKINFILATDLILEMQAQAQVNMGIIVAVKKALSASGIISYFQPIVDNKTRKIVKFESLVRLVDDHLNLWFPSDFLEISKKGRYYTQITQRVLDNSFKALYETNVGISINLSAVDIEENVTRRKIMSLLDMHKEHAHRITFELLEDASIKEFEVIKQFIKEVKSRGVSIAIDDFGSGYSNFGRLLDYEPDIIKIDGSLVKNIASDDYSISIVKTIVSFANEHQIKTIAEFVENEVIFNILTTLGVHYSQGYYFGKPLLLKEYNTQELL